MEIIDRKKLEEIEFCGKNATVFREVYNNDIWKFVLVIEDRRIVMISY